MYLHGLKKRTKFKAIIYLFSPSPLLALRSIVTLPLLASFLETSQCVTLSAATFWKAYNVKGVSSTRMGIW